ncbi:50S ribosomal protein L7ae-like protein [Bacillus cytotoxicus]|uniref:Ribosomal protein L7Ae/L30e/S12e/Gadd45 n=2 Tax=Bacillus cytotoxicus TaxID=580165 RepID=A0AAX2CCV5_9BACI|nr:MULTISPECIES: 50S ribosomal protein L7ae-like protein [Bacillus cereus group]ABS20472.1 ribosomal protein L7Ae/L30e/S12e/Gadd45 [Bacillus cytotoxicus NVH 391-98]AWC27084.1 50S ribosomal protein L7ae-like protein [Bacillus cytotoxicus]AWC31143.1 50S ribosomal protein L7ae-like protein [Bacillus cytotoxicus]AWC35185.1 50S ribosomal protein L7ae-like protein [Bacillus cytotoxicus]AWC39198.1 50S ribosomal protein L7ae-like protein [Bacillus cytotoxicus]
MSYQKVSNAENVIVGHKRTLKAIKNGIVKEVVVAEDADMRLTHVITQAALQHNIPVTKVESIRELGRVSGIQVGASAIGIIS